MPHSPSLMNPSSANDFISLFDATLLTQPVGQIEYNLMVVFTCSQEVAMQIESAYLSVGWTEVTCDRYVNKTILNLKV